MNVRAEKLLWEKIPDGEWLSQSELREIVTDNKAHPLGVPMADAAIGWLVDGGYVRWRAAPSFDRRPSLARPPLQYRRNPLSEVPHEAMVQRDAEEMQRQHAQAKSARNSDIDQRLRELGIIKTDTLQETA